MRDFPEEKISGMMAVMVGIEGERKSAKAAGVPVGRLDGSMPCPVCGVGVVNWSWAGPRAIRAQCDAPDCLKFMS